MRVILSVDTKEEVSPIISIMHITQQGELYILDTAIKVIQKENLKCGAQII